MIAFERVQARVPPIAIADLTVNLDAGVHALLGGKDDGAAVVLAIASGRVAARAGVARVLGHAAGDARVRAQVAHVPLDAALPEPMRVDEALAIASVIRGGPRRDPLAALEPLGLASLARRPVRTLSLEERRAVAIAEALASDARVLLIEEPLASVDPRATSAIAAALRAKGRAGACVVFATGSVRDARALADDVLAFDRGRLARRAPATDPLALHGPHGAALHVVASDAAKLAAALARDPAVASIALEPSAVVARGADAIALARAAARAAREADVTIEALRPALAAHADLRAAIAGDTAAAYAAAYERARRAALPEGTT